MAAIIRQTVTTEFPHLAPATVQAVRLELREVDSGAVVGTAVVCPAARYASVAWRGSWSKRSSVR